MAPKSFSLSSRIKLSNGLSMPTIHLGVYLTSGRETSSAVTHALNCGYRAIDSAQMYRNERECGTAISAFVKSSGVPRQDIHFTSKLATNGAYETARRSISQSVKACGLEYVDLFLLHSPYGGREARLQSWKAVEDAIDSGEVRSGGVSNYGVKHLEELLATKPKHRPVVNQIEVHPFNTHEDITAWCAQHDIVVEAYAPLVRAMKMSDRTVVMLSNKYRCTAGQLLIRWSLQRGYVPLPKSVRKERIEENGKVDGFEIEEEDMQMLNGLDEGLVTDWDPLDAE